ncbi:hypothetical protein [Aliikangiella maris]|uniref:Uncharacterized protein n=2 Tax=Aliikangiella maris TaxID=3162458 RepID=A0ABV2BWA1_9GAMM
MKVLDYQWLSEKGLNLQALLDLDSIPTDIYQTLKSPTYELADYQQILIIGHAGRLLWQRLQQAVSSQALNPWCHQHPIDEYSHQMLERFLNNHQVEDFQLIYPGGTFSGLQQLGKVIGWHHSAPFRIGINQQWGSWFAYRAVALMKGRYDKKGSTIMPSQNHSPCDTCETKICIQACPANALQNDALDLTRCLTYRQQPDSLCADRCIARMSCPVAPEHQYDISQINYHYIQSLRFIRQHD